MIPALVSLKGLIKPKSYHIDYPLFRLHYQATVCVLLGFCLILTAKILFGDTIDCKGRLSGRDEFYDNFCYSRGTYTTYTYANTTRDGKPWHTTSYLYSGIPIPHPSAKYNGHLWHRYYQYMPIILFLQAVFFYLPHYLWKIWENGRISSVCKQLHDHRFSPTEYIESNHHLIDYLQNCFIINKSLIYKYHMCHLLLLINLISQIIALDNIFNYQFITYGYDVFLYLIYHHDKYGMRDASNEPRDLNNPMDYVFPKLTSCTVNVLSQSGNVPDDMKLMCVLPLNILHDKFFLISWFWFLTLTVLTVLQIIHDILFVTIPRLRNYVFERRYGPYLYDSCRHNRSMAELFMLDIIGSNSDRFAFAALLKQLTSKSTVV